MKHLSTGRVVSILFILLVIVLYFTAKDRWLDDEHKHAYRYDSKLTVSATYE